MAFELAHQFQQRGGVVEKVILFDGASAIPGPFQAAWRQWRRQWTNAVAGFHVNAKFAAIRSFAKDSKLTGVWLLRQLVRAGRAKLNRDPPNRPPDDFTGFRDERGTFISSLILGRLYDNAVSTYKPRSLQASGILVRAEPFEANEKPYRDFDPSLGWGQLFTQGLEIIQATGDHLSMIERDENIVPLARELQRVLDPHHEAVPAEWLP
jgi:thioesterase domain-containing protein